MSCTAQLHLTGWPRLKMTTNQQRLMTKPNWHLEPLPARDPVWDDFAEMVQYLRELVWCSPAIPARFLEHVDSGAELARIQDRLDEMQDEIERRIE